MGVLREKRERKGQKAYLKKSLKTSKVWEKI
jgi:hypothetical protein